MPPGSFLPRCARDAISFLPRSAGPPSRSATPSPGTAVPTPLPVRVRSWLVPTTNENRSPRLPHPRAPACTPTNRRTCYLVHPCQPEREGERRECEGEDERRPPVDTAHAPTSPSLFPPARPSNPSCLPLPRIPPPPPPSSPDTPHRSNPSAVLLRAGRLR